MEKKRRLISLMLAGVMATSVGAMAGCDNSVDTDMGYNHYKNVYIILDQNEKDILHKGDFYNSIKDADNKFDLKCTKGNHIITNADFSVMENQPDEDLYDEKCEDCFSK